MLRVLIEPSSVAETKSGVKNDKTWSIVQQKVRLFSPGSQFPDSFMLVLPDGVMGYPPGEYIWDVSTQIERGSYDSVAFSRGQRLISATPENVQYLLARVQSQFSFVLQAQPSQATYGLVAQPQSQPQQIEEQSQEQPAPFEVPKVADKSFSMPSLKAK